MISPPPLFLAHLWRAHLALFLANCGKYCIVVLSRMSRLPLVGFKDFELTGMHLDSEDENDIASMLSFLFVALIFLLLSFSAFLFLK